MLVGLACIMSESSHLTRDWSIEFAVQGHLFPMSGKNQVRLTENDPNSNKRGIVSYQESWENLVAIQRKKSL